MNGLVERLGDVFSKDRFDSDLRNSLKRRNLSISHKDGGIYHFTDRNTIIKKDLSDIRRNYESGALSRDNLDKLAEEIAGACDMEKRMVSFTNGQTFLRFAVMRDSDVSSEMVYTDFTDGLKKVMVYTSDDLVLHPLENSVVKKWGVPREVLFSVADRNMCRLLDKAEVKESEITDGIKVMEFELPSKHLAVSLMMCNDFRKAVEKYMGTKFLVVAPSRDSLLILENITNNILERIGKVVVREYLKSENPLTTDVMLFTPDKIQIAGRFAVKRSAAVSEPGRKIT